MPRSGLVYSSYYESNLTARWWHLTPSEFRDLDGEEQSEMVATYRGYMQSEAVIAQEQARKQEQKARKDSMKNKRGGRR